jgi:hypothetical protein
MAHHRILIRRSLWLLGACLCALMVLRWLVVVLTTTHLHGTVVDSVTARPVEHALVVASRARTSISSVDVGRAQIAEVRTDEHGRFQVELRSRSASVLLGDITVVVMAPDHLPAIVNPGDPPPWVDRMTGHASGDLIVKLAPSSAPMPAEIVDQMKALFGHLYGRNPIACALIEVPQYTDYMDSFEAVRPDRKPADRKEEEGCDD